VTTPRRGDRGRRSRGLQHLHDPEAAVPALVEAAQRELAVAVLVAVGGTAEA
jgi:hypothetical protein